MPTGSPRCVRPVRGFTYLVLLFALALAGAALARLGPPWQQAAQRGREAELLFRGGQIRDALQRFHDSTPGGTAALPAQLDELLTDRRGPTPRHHLRRLYTDPFTGRADWLAVRDATGGIVGVRSRSQRPALRRQDVPPLAAAAASPPGRPAAPSPPVDRDDRPPVVGDWLFTIPHTAPARSTAPRRPP